MKKTIFKGLAVVAVAVALLDLVTGGSVAAGIMIISALIFYGVSQGEV